MTLNRNGREFIILNRGEKLVTYLQRRHSGSDNEERRPLPHYFSGKVTGEERTGELQLFFLGLGKRRQG